MRGSRDASVTRIRGEHGRVNMMNENTQDRIMEIARRCIDNGTPLPSDIRWQLTDEQRMELRQYHLIHAKFIHVEESTDGK